MPGIDKTKPIPLYYQIVEDVKRKIDNREFKPGDRLPTEQWISEYYDVSRVTVRKAIEELIAAGAIYRVRGKGPVVSAPKFNRRLQRLTGLHEELTEAGMVSSSRILDVQRIGADGRIARLMGIPDGETILSFRRLRYNNQVPIADQRIYLNESFCRGFDPAVLTDRSLYQILEEEYRLQIDFADQTMSVKIPTRKQVEELDIQDKKSLLCMNRTTYLVTGEVIEYTEISYVADRYEFSIRLYR